MPFIENALNNEIAEWPKMGCKKICEEDALNVHSKKSGEFENKFGMEFLGHKFYKKNLIT